MTQTNGMNSNEPTQTTEEVTLDVSDAVKRAFAMLVEESGEAQALFDLLETRNAQLEALGVSGERVSQDPFVVEFLRRIDNLFPSLMEEARGVEVLIENRENHDSS